MSILSKVADFFVELGGTAFVLVGLLIVKIVDFIYHVDEDDY